jgi:prepilin-type N-terminal cleavage/methylation domain-containing protein
MTFLNKKSNFAFSLVELSIVLVILGLLTGGVVTGRSLIRAAELRAIPTEISQFQTAAMTFKQKYFALPGDMANATQFWGRLNGQCTTHTPAPSVTNDGVCNGDGDGLVNNETGDGSGNWNEAHMFWRHLQKAGLISGTFTGRSESGTNNWNNMAGINVPVSKISGTGYFTFSTGPSIHSWFAVSLAPWWYTLEYPHSISYGKPDELGAESALTPKEAWNIDKKIDDGHPAQGKVISDSWNDWCSAARDGASHATNNYDAIYRLTSTEIECALLFREQY